MAANNFEVGAPDEKGKRAVRIMAFVVLGPAHGVSAGRVKPVPLAANINSPLVDYKDDVARISTLEEKRARTAGVECSAFIEDLYLAEGNAAGLRAYLAHQQAVYDGRTKTPFPNDLLPKKVRVWSGTAETKAAQFDPRAFIEAEKPASPSPKPGAETKRETKPGNG